jgi:3-isopropylmalate/(R)-2-methylmalate dehydratase large subunit
MNQTFAQKALARASRDSNVAPGQIVDAYPDLYMSHAASWRCIAALEKLGTKKLFDVDRIAMVMDHLSPAGSAKVAGYHSRCRSFANEMGIRTFYDVDAGIAHLVLTENGHIRPGQLIIGTDSHSTIYGSLGAFGTGVGFSEITAAWVTGKIWLKVPESIKVTIEGSLAPGTYVMDLMLSLIGRLGADGATYRSVEFHGGYVRGTALSERMNMCNLSMEMGAKNAFVAPDDLTRDYLQAAGVPPDSYEELHPDADADYVDLVEMHASAIGPQVARPHRVDNVSPVDDVAGTRVDQVFIGSCANAKIDDLVIAAKILRGKRVAAGTRLLITPGSRAIATQAAERGLLTTFLEAGALITNPGCGACAGDGGAMAAGEVTLSTSNRNYQGRMGSYDADIYLASPATAAATALAGRIADPREVIG